jgi:predicted phosphodiesterase
MALLGVLGDIHGNREALEAALAALRQRQVDRLLCLGDVVGYNADPDECVEIVRSRSALTIAGNHDLIALRKLGFSRCSNKAMYALKRTRETLGDEAASWLEGLPRHRLLDDGVVMVHGGVRDVQQYMLTPAHIAENAAYLREDFPGARLCFFGHSHEQRIWAAEGDAVRQVAAEDSVYLVKHLAYFINPGSVDASRKRGEKLAECAVLDTDEWRIDLVRVPYDAAASEAKASTFGYRIDPWTSRFYDFRRRISQIGALRFL